MHRRPGPTALLVPLLLAVAAPPAPADEPPTASYDHRRVDYLLDEAGREEPVDSPETWQRRRRAILAGMQAATGPLPDRESFPPLDVRVVETKSFERFERRTITYVADETGRVHADLYLPKGLEPGEKRPAMLALHPTGPLGKRIVAGEGPRPNRQYATELAERGYVVLAPDYPSFGDDADYDFESDPYVSGTMKGIVNHLRGVDLLAARPEVDGDRIGVIGHSLGGHNAIFAGVFDERLKVVVSSCGWTPFHDYYGGKIAGWTSPRYMPLLKTKYDLDPNEVPFDFPELIAALAPRPFFSNSPIDDSNFDVAGVRKAVPEAAKIYDLLGAKDVLQVRYPPCEHDFPTEIRTEAYAFVDAALKHEPTGDVDFSAELPRIEPLSPEEGRKSIATLPGYRIELTAAEPLVVDPVAMSFDADGRLYVVEMRDYSEQDQEMLGRVRLLEDTDGDGRFDEAEVFIDGLSWPTAITCWDGGVFVGAPPHLYYLKDTTGDGTADEKRIVFTGFGRSNVQGMMNSLRWGIDCRIHGATSSSGGTITRPDDPTFQPVNLAGRDFSFDPRTLDLRPESGGAQHGMCFDEWGTKFVCSNSDHLQAVLYDDRYAARHPYLKAPPARVSIAADGGQAPVFRRSPIEPWRIVRTRLRVAGAVKGPVEGGGKPAGYFTGATGVTIYGGDLLPELRGLAFIGDVGSNLVHRKKITPRGTGFVGERIDEGKEFLASTDIWFRPVQMANGPDGTLHVLDMYREVIEHPKSLPPEIKQHLDLTSGRDRGRLYRVVPDGEFERRSPKLSNLSDTDLAGLLFHENAWHRETASRLLVERGTIGNAEPLVPVLKVVDVRADSARGLVHGLHVLDAIGQLSPSHVALCMSADHSHVREHALRLAERFPDDDDIRQSMRDVHFVSARGHDRERLQLAFSAGAFPMSVKGDVLAGLLEGDGADPWIRFAALSSLVEGSDAVLAELLGQESFARTDIGRDVLGELAELIGRQANRNEVAHVVSAVATANGNEAVQEVTRRLALGLAASKSPLAKDLAGGDLAKTLDSLVATARRTARGNGATDERLAAIRTLSLGTADDIDLLLGLLDVREPEAVQLAALGTLGARDEERIGPALVERWSTFTPAVRREAIETVLSRDAWRTAFLTTVEQETIPRAEVDTARLAILRTTADAVTERRLDTILAKLAGGKRADIVAKYRPALELAGDVERGRTVFKKTCAVCHRLEDHGFEIGPNLATLKNRGPEAILVNVLDPNREVNPEFLNYVVVTTDGRQHVGILASQTATSVTLRRPEDKTETLLRADVEIIRSSGLSMMPEGVEKDVSIEAMADLLAYLQSLK